MRERILVMTCDPTREELYELALKLKGFVTRTLPSRGGMAKSLDCWEPQEGMIEDVLNFCPRIIVCDLGTYTDLGAVLRFLTNLREAAGKNEYPMYLFTLPSDFYPSGYEFLIDAWLPSPVNFDEFFKTIEELLA